MALQARFRVYGAVSPVIPSDVHEEFDLAHVFSGGRVVFTSDQHFGVGSNLILPGRGKTITALRVPLCHSFPETQGRIWAMAGKPSEAVNRVTKIGLSLNCKFISPPSIHGFLIGVPRPYVSLCTIQSNENL